jgi:hypothetical protein
MAPGDAVDEVLRELARESGRTLAELGVRRGDEKWIRAHARAIASLRGMEGRSAFRTLVGSLLQRLRRR